MSEIKKWTISNDDNSALFTVEGDNYLDAAYEALRQLGWHVQAKDGETKDEKASNYSLDHGDALAAARKKEGS